MFQLNVGNKYFGFNLISKEPSVEIDSDCYIFQHEKTGAKLFYAKNKDVNKVFFVSFKTPPENHCGTAHILEHSVLCGSKKYPSKDPFNELMKGSLNTYLNALTYGDKTMYPVASCNHEDFQNLMDVYLDAVFNPQVINEDKIFKQEGWHYELLKESDPITIKGVVYNEMKGALSSADRVLNNVINESLFEKSIYKYESGGDPDHIPNLSYEEFIEFYNKYYHPTNSFFYLYGDLDIEKALEKINGEYLEKYEKTKEIPPFEVEPKKDKRGFVSGTYSVPVGTKTDKESLLSLNFVVGLSTDRLLTLSMNVLSYILMETGASPVKNAIINKKIAGSAEGWFDSSAYEMVFSIVAKNSSCKKLGLFKNTVFSVLEELVTKGIDEDLIESAINYYEFILREEDFGNRPKGLAHGMTLMKGWLNGQNPHEAIKIWEHFDTMRKLAKDKYFEKLIYEKILCCHNSSLAAIAAEEGKQEKVDLKLTQKLQKMKDDMTAEEINNLIKETNDLIEYQTTPDKEEDVAKVPVLKKEQISKKAEYEKFEEKVKNGVTHIVLPLETNAIVYTKLFFNTESLALENIPYAGLLGRIIGRIDTAMFSYEKLPTEIDMYTGGVYSRLNVYNKENGFSPEFTVSGKALFRNLDKLFNILREVTLCNKYNKDSLLKIINEIKAGYESRFDNNGHVVALNRGMASIDQGGKYKELSDGLDFYNFLIKEMENMDLLCQKLDEVAKEIFTKENLKVGICCENSQVSLVEEKIAEFINYLPIGEKEKSTSEIPLTPINEAISTGAKIVYNTKVANYKDIGFEYSGKLMVLKNIINTQYLWNEVRV
ncbi:MAG: insulinase family protein, partial [Anaerotignaceae bacterium]